MSARWSAADVPDQSGRVAIVTGSNTGIGYEAAAVLADKGAQVVLAVRNVDKGNEAKARIWNFLAQSPEMGALPTLRAGTDPGVQNGEYYGPDGIGEQRGHPKRVESSAQSHDEDIQRRLWTVSEELTGVTYPV